MAGVRTELLSCAASRCMQTSVLARSTPLWESLIGTWIWERRTMPTSAQQSDRVQWEGTQVIFGNPMIVQMRAWMNALMTPSKQRIWPMKRLPAEVSEQVLCMCSRSSTI